MVGDLRKCHLVLFIGKYPDSENKMIIIYYSIELVCIHVCYMLYLYMYLNLNAQFFPYQSRFNKELPGIMFQVVSKKNFKRPFK